MPSDIVIKKNPGVTFVAKERMIDYHVSTNSGHAPWYVLYNLDANGINDIIQSGFLIDTKGVLYTAEGDAVSH